MIESISNVRCYWPKSALLHSAVVEGGIRRGFIATGKLVLSTSELMRWTHPRPGGNEHSLDGRERLA
jgi:hypothetical protein